MGWDPIDDLGNLGGSVKHFVSDPLESLKKAEDNKGVQLAEAIAAAYYGGPALMSATSGGIDQGYGVTTFPLADNGAAPGGFSGFLNGAESLLSSSAGAALISGGFNALGSSQVNSANQASVLQQEQFAASMANTQHQREVADLKAAGLNPILSGTGGSGNAAPVGSTFQSTNVLGNAVNSALDASRIAKGNMLLKSQIDNVDQDTTYKAENTALTSDARRKVLAETDNVRKNNEILTQTARSAEADADVAEMERDRARVQKGFDASKAGGMLYVIDQVLKPLQHFFNAAETAKRYSNR